VVRRFLSPETLPPPFGYSHVVEVRLGRVIYVSGQGPLDVDGRLVGEDDFEGQVRQVFENLQAALDAAGAAFTDVVKLNYYVVDVSKLPALRAIRDEYVDTVHPPASTLVEVSRLFRDDVLIEIDAVAVAD
jgi:enamine deaminase RidA (YjgF/YER057c/UK114 family)